MKIFVFVLLLILALFMLGPAVWMLKFVVTRFLAFAGVIAIAFLVLTWEKA